MRRLRDLTPFIAVLLALAGGADGGAYGPSGVAALDARRGEATSAWTAAGGAADVGPCAATAPASRDALSARTAHAPLDMLAAERTTIRLAAEEGGRFVGLPPGRARSLFAAGRPLVLEPQASRSRAVLRDRLDYAAALAAACRGAFPFRSTTLPPPLA